jgi:acyl phosphate:glycerol-3-phosphate acyltransferase
MALRNRKKIVTQLHSRRDSFVASYFVPIIVAMLLGYVLGSIPFGVILTRISGGGDLREIGSGNIGATNVLRTGNKALAALTLILDIFKGCLAVWLAIKFLPGMAAVAAAGAFFGHLYPVWLQFKGGKGVATYAGIMVGLFWQGGVVYALAWILALAIFRISSVAGLCAAIAAPVAAFYFGRLELVAMLAACSMIVFWKHRENIERLFAGQEPRVGSKSSQG